jgi:hypothetical protein
VKSPFPGMDPYIESCGLWEDFHAALIYEIRVALSQAVPARYVVRSGERSYLVLIESEDKLRHAFVPDVAVTLPREGGTAVAEPPEKAPHVMRAFIEEEHREAFVEIFEVGPEQRLVTTVEVLSPSNKRPGTEGWDLYLRKRQSLLLGGVNLVEIDLLRDGRRMPTLDPWPDSPYTVLVARARKVQACLVWPASFQEPLPEIQIPLAKPDPAIPLDLQTLLDKIYRTSHYERSIDYSRPLTPPLSPEDAAWCQQRLRTRTRRS